MVIDVIFYNSYTIVFIMAKNIVLCCDGTGNEIEKDLSNVLKLYRITQKNAEQIVFYDPGIGTISTKSIWQRIKQKCWEFFCLATGTGLDDNILDAYKFLIDNYEKGDRIFLFGFSRGAYTVRVLAGLIHLVGLLRPEQKNLAEYALKAYKQAASDSDFKIAWRFKKITSARTVPLKFIGVWDTVSSVITPRPDRFYIPSLQTLPYTRANPSVEIFRHAISIDEKRAMFKVNRWVEPQTYQPDRFNDPEAAQNTKQVWFAGDHCDVGGGYPETESHLSKFALKWMIEEAQNFGLRTDKNLFDHLVLGQSYKSQTAEYVVPDITGKIHSMPWFYLFMELLPLPFKYRNSYGHRTSFCGFYLPLCDLRLIPENAFIHHSVVERMQKIPAYRPENLPHHYRVVYDEGQDSEEEGDDDA